MFPTTAIGSVIFGEHKEVFESSMHLMLFGPNHVPTKQQFNLKILVSFCIAIQHVIPFNFINFLCDSDSRAAK